MAPQPSSRPTERRNAGLIVERYPSQSVVIADGIEVILLATKAGRAKLGVIAPEGMNVTRKEAWQRGRGSGA